MFGPPQAAGIDSNGVGPMDVWALRFGCGLEVRLLAFHWRSPGIVVPWDDPNVIEVHANSKDGDHVAAHVPFELMTLQVPDERESPRRSWVLKRQDDLGNVFEVRSYSSRCAAEREQARLEGTLHKQTYWIDDLSTR